MKTNNWSKDDKQYKMRPMPLSVSKNHSSQLNTIFIQLILQKLKHSLAEILAAITKKDCGESYIKQLIKQAHDCVAVDYNDSNCSFVGARRLDCHGLPMVIIDCPRTVYWDDISFICFVFYHGYDNFKLHLDEEVVYTTFEMRTGQENCVITEFYKGQETMHKTTHEAMVEELIYYVNEIVGNNNA